MRQDPAEPGANDDRTGAVPAFSDASFTENEG